MTSFEYPHPDFDEAAYLKANPDVARQVATVAGFTGWHHFFQHGFRQSRRGVPPRIAQAVRRARQRPREDPAPPPHLRLRVHGAEDLPSFDQVGRRVATNIFDVLATADVARVERIYDFGCGPGRVLLPLRRMCARLPFRAGQPQFFGSDIDPEAIAWCEENLAGRASFAVNGINPPLPYADGFFDFVYSISVFTHLPEDMQLGWLAELRRVTRPGARLALTVHGESMFGGSLLGRLWYRTRGFVYRRYQNTEGLPDFYQTAFHDERYIRSRWSRFFEIERIVPKGVAGRQDLVVCRRN